jgi:hypothetical protein
MHLLSSYLFLLIIVCDYVFYSFTFFLLLSFFLLYYVLLLFIFFLFLSAFIFIWGMLFGEWGFRGSGLGWKNIINNKVM